ncbi:PepSY domain-containing protein [Streptomyces phaeoluteigriseus]|uniref:PepSY domain-containing protein n=1 Tax=Streptomyces phaeoluteigriseus TaxID=114686 RepID=UPI001FE9E97D|nr:PepSY domain-containing protein [Streptomyces phaeoluteigriseus]
MPSGRLGQRGPRRNRSRRNQSASQREETHEAQARHRRRRRVRRDRRRHRGRLRGRRRTRYDGGRPDRTAGGRGTRLRRRERGRGDRGGVEGRPGTAVSADLDTEAGDDDRGWEVEILGTGTTSYDVLVDPATGRVLGTHTAGDDADDVREARTLLRGTGVTAAEAAEKATTKGFVTSVDLEADGAGAWEVETDGSSAEERDWNVALDDAKLTAVRDDDGQDETGDDD